MRTTIDPAGRIVIPSDLRSAAGLAPGAAVEVNLRDGIVTIEPAAASVKVSKKGRLKVAALEESEPLKEETVREVRDAGRGRSR